MNFVGNHILSVNQFGREDIERLFQVADGMREFTEGQKRTRVLQGAILANMFFEPSTRTRVSFGSAFNLLGGDVRETAELKASSVAKGESLHDFARVLSGYSDIIVMRHPKEGAVEEFAHASRVPVINGGDGANEHPSQALLDLYTIEKELSQRGTSMDGMRIAVIGDLKYGRAVHSLLKLLAVFTNVTVHLVSPPDLALPRSIADLLVSQSHTVNTFTDLAQGIQHVDILYVTRTQEERFPTQELADRYRGLFRLNEAVYTQHCEPNTVIMHPLPRDSREAAQELASDLDSNSNLAIFRQTDNGVLVRMALFAMVLDVVEQVHAHAVTIPWRSVKRPL